jgi:hypothetical protein
MRMSQIGFLCFFMTMTAQCPVPNLIALKA